MLFGDVAGAGLVLVEDLPYQPVYHEDGWPGATDRLYLHALTHRRLLAVAAGLRAGGRDLGLLVFDGFRPGPVQRGLFEECSERMREGGGDARTFVSDPGTVYPHGTGGAVDLTLTVGGEPAWMGTAFDEFTGQSARNWYRDHPPRGARDREAAANREVLFAAMAQAGFAGHPAEWWHFEYGTARWAAAGGTEPLLTTLLHPPL